MLVIAGLGNPGTKYQNHRHNVGFMAADEIVRRHSFGPWKTKFNAEISEGKIGTEKVLVIKPQTMMNLSGDAIGKALRFYKLTENDLIVFYDELDLAPGKLRVKIGGGSGGHNGIKSIDDHCGKNYKRLRIGIGHPGHKERVVGHVLGDFAKADHSWLEPTLEAIADNISILTEGNDPEFLNKIAIANGSDERAEAKKKPAPSKPKKSHIHQARNAKSKELPKSGPMADMLKKLFGKE